MRITAIAREDLSNICNGLIPNEIHLELKGMIVPDSYGTYRAIRYRESRI